ncbi:MAG: molecular chaperone DnaJ [bacterium]|nr:molecular chaperone DnaJ [bacterium]
MAADYYNLLGVERSANEEEIKRAFRKAAHKHHPDKQGGDAAKFKEINEAYQVLSNQEKRAQHDQCGRTFDGPGGPAAGGPGAGGYPFGAGSAGFSTEDLGDIFGDLFGFNRRGRTRVRQRGDDIQLILRLDFNDAAFGGTKEIELTRLTACESCAGTGDKNKAPKKCSTCDGLGKVREVRQTILGTIAQERLCQECQGDGKVASHPCMECSSQGRVRTTERLGVEVPAGIDNDQIIKLSGQGDVGRRATPAGDLLLTIRVTPSDTFVRDGADVKTHIDLEYPQLVLGDEIDIQGLQGELSLSIQSGTQPGSIVRLRGEGIPILNGNGRGDLFVEVGQVTPKKVSKEERELLEKLAHLRGQNLTRKKRRLFSK